MWDNGNQVADDEISVGNIYKNRAIATNYIEKRSRFSWQRVLHHRQVSAINRVIVRYRPERVLEIAPGPGRLTVDIRGIKEGLVIENSEEMIAIAQERLRANRLDGVWKVMRGNAFELGKTTPKAAFDLAFTFRFIRHFRVTERERLYSSIRECLKPQGILMFDVVDAPLRARIDARNTSEGDDEIAIYDASYTEPEFVEEMKTNGFEVLQFVPVIRHFRLQSWISGKLDDVFPKIATRAVYLLENAPSRWPLEWIALCRRV